MQFDQRHIIAGAHIEFSLIVTARVNSIRLHSMQTEFTLSTVSRVRVIRSICWASPSKFDANRLLCIYTFNLR